MQSRISALGASDFPAGPLARMIHERLAASAQVALWLRYPSNSTLEDQNRSPPVRILPLPWQNTT